MKDKYIPLIVIPLTLIFIFLIPKTANCQIADSSSVVDLGKLSNKKEILKVIKKFKSLHIAMNRQTIKAMKTMQKEEYKISKRIPKTDSVVAADMFTESQQKYTEIKTLLFSSPKQEEFSTQLKSYLPNLDSLQTAISFLQQKNLNLSNEELSRFSDISGELKQTFSKLQAANTFQSFISEKQKVLEDRFSKYGLNKKILKIKKEVYYYQQRVEQFKEALNDHNKIKEQIINVVARQPAFQKFWQKNSILGKLFPMPESTDTSSSKMLEGLQTKTQVGKLIAERLGKNDNDSKSGNEINSYLSAQIQQGKSQLDQLKNKARSLGIKGSGNNLVIPDFLPNSQKTKTFLKRIEFGFNIQNSSAATSFSGTAIVPGMSNIAITAGYKFNDRFILSTGISYILGWGVPFKNIHFSSQGVGFRGGAELKLKGNFWLSTGYEYNYIHAFAEMRDLYNMQHWQKSALVGLTKKYKLGNKTANLQLLYDLLSHSQIPRISPFKYRIGYNF